MKLTRRRLFGLLAGTAVAIGVPSAWMSRMKTYAGPLSDHFNGTHFFDPDGAPPRPLWQVLRWQATKQAAKWPQRLRRGDQNFVRAAGDNPAISRLPDELNALLATRLNGAPER